jgi:hypothetical protein
MPGWAVAMKMLGFSAAKNSKIFACASLEDTLDERPGRYRFGTRDVSDVRPSNAALEASAVGKNALAVKRTPFALIYTMGKYHD